MDLNNITDATGRTVSADWLNTACLGVIFIEMQEEM